jgi:hypothetical protein
MPKSAEHDDPGVDKKILNFIRDVRKELRTSKAKGLRPLNKITKKLKASAIPRNFSDAVVADLPSRKKTRAYLLYSGPVGIPGTPTPQELKHNCGVITRDGQVTPSGPIGNAPPLQPGDTIVCEICTPAIDENGRVVRDGTKAVWLCNYYIRMM